MGKKRRFKFVGVDSFAAAERIIGQTIFVETDDDDKIMLIGKELLGFDVVTDMGISVGILSDVVWLPTNDAYLINDGEREFLIPVIPEVVQGVNFDEKLIIISPIDDV